MATEQHKRPASRSPPAAWQRSSYHPPPPRSSTPTIQAFTPTPRPESLNPDAVVKPIPAPAYIDLGPVKAEKEIIEARPSLSVSTNTAAPAPPPPLSSPGIMYGPPAGQPPPYSRFPPQSLAAPTSTPTSQTVPAPSASLDSHRDSREDIPADPTRQSLPSISEALNLPPMVSQASQPNGAAVPPPPPPPSFSQAAGLTDSTYSVTSGSPSVARSHISSHHPSSLSSFSSQQSPHDAKPPDSTLARNFVPTITDSPRSTHYPPYSSQAASPIDSHARRMSPSLAHMRTTATSQHPSTSLPPPHAAQYAPRPSYPHPAASHSLAPATSQPGHLSHLTGSANGQPNLRPHYPPGAGYSFPPPATSGLSYQESLAAGAAQQQWSAHAELEKVDEMRRQASVKRGSFSGQGYGMVVKRHLEEFDVEHGLNEIAERTGAVFDFSKRYSAQAFRYTRGTVPVDQLPKNEVIMEMITQSMAITDALHRLRGTVEGMHLAAEENARQQQQQQQNSAMNKPGMFPPYAADSASHPGYGTHAGQEKLSEKADVGSGGFNGADSKKRRGRNAPPGRCHSCNRAETPEWRRGPDGARTLCNACGLHYAKLTRKMGKNTGQAAGSNLRPKEGEDTMP